MLRGEAAMKGLIPMLSRPGLEKYDSSRCLASFLSAEASRTLISYLS